jgi:hypothetical protein
MVAWSGIAWNRSAADSRYSLRFPKRLQAAGIRREWSEACLIACLAERWSRKNPPGHGNLGSETSSAGLAAAEAIPAMVAEVAIPRANGDSPAIVTGRTVGLEARHLML